MKPSQIDPLLKAALREDVGSKDLTSSALIPKSAFVKADIAFKENGVLCGIGLAERVFRLVDEDLRFLPVAEDGESIEKDREIAYIEGRGPSILIAERTALNFLSRLSGIATLTRAFVEKVKGTSAKIMDTRKTTPTLRFLERYAVKTGGGVNHRLGLFDEILIKDNHLRILLNQPLTEIVARAKASAQKKTAVGVEVKNLKECAEALKSKADYILLDNLSVSEVKEAVALRAKAGAGIDLEVSGGIWLGNVREYAETGVERISVGSLTHSSPAVDISLNMV
ncbi:MAG: carboxylating nicotinate-nucleotide diphosphorylase [Candidatus Omnitrophica bacterium]|nr:carboxylating nicotinate-nucleotide diphosphorylase [Candidatus Omnitrophota bacterium]